MIIIDTHTYLADEILLKIDRVEMVFSIECRMQLLDYWLAGLERSLPQGMKFRDDLGEWVLRLLQYCYVPKKLIERPEMVFGGPIFDWLHGLLKNGLEALLDKARLRRKGLFHTDWIRFMWAEHLSGALNWQRQRLTILIFLDCLEEER
jgi:asparagine synthase (glutamine-hydrolysing)